MTIHDKPHADAGRFVILGDAAADTVNNAVVPGEQARVIDWYDRVTSRSWQKDHGDDLALAYAWRAGFEGIVHDDEVVIAEIRGARHVVHVTEIGGATDAAVLTPA